MNEVTNKVNKIPYTEGFKAIELALEYISQQDEMIPLSVSENGRV